MSTAISSYTLEVHCLGILLRRPDLLYQVDRRLQEEGLARLSAEDFEHADHQAIMRLFQDSVDQDMAEPLNFVFNSLSLPMMELADGLLERTAELDPNEERVLEDLMRGLLDLRQRRLTRRSNTGGSCSSRRRKPAISRATQDTQTMVKLTQVKSID